MHQVLSSFFYLFLSGSLLAAHIEYDTTSDVSVIIPDATKVSADRGVTLFLSPGAVNKQAHGTPTAINAAIQRRCAYYETIVLLFPRLVEHYSPECIYGVVLMHEKKDYPDIERTLSYSPAEKNAAKRAEELCIGNSYHQFHNLFWLESELTAVPTAANIKDDAARKALLSQSPCGDLNAAAHRFVQERAQFFRLVQSIRDRKTAEEAANKLSLAPCKKAYKDYQNALQSFNTAHPLRMKGAEQMPNLVTFDEGLFATECERIMNADYYGSPQLRERLISLSEELLPE